MRREFLSRQKQWEMDRARTAPEAPPAPDDEEQVEDPSIKEGKSLQVMLAPRD